SLRQSHSSSVHGETKSTFSADVTNRLCSGVMRMPSNRPCSLLLFDLWDAVYLDLFPFCPAFLAPFAFPPTGIALNFRVISISDCSTPIRSRLDAPTNPTQSVRSFT